MSDSFQSLYVPGLKGVFNHPVTGEEYQFNVQGGVFAYPGKRQSDAMLELICWRGRQKCIITTYNIEPMNDFSLLAFFNQYRELLENWIITADLVTKITTADQAFSAGPGPVIRINGKASNPTSFVEVIKG